MMESFWQFDHIIRCVLWLMVMALHTLMIITIIIIYNNDVVVCMGASSDFSGSRCSKIVVNRIIPIFRHKLLCWTDDAERGKFWLNRKMQI